jgi:DNA-binding NtrC family response regulator
MPIPLLICDDSNMARKQVRKALPASWEVDVSFATNGREGLQAIREGRGEVVFLDLTMPEVDGYEVLQKIREEGLKCLVIVISADIQPEARARVMKEGAIAFIKKPINGEKLMEVLRGYGLI